MSVKTSARTLCKALPQALVAAGLALPIATPVWAQGSAMLEEVVVTASKRQQTLQEVPIAVSVVSSETI